MELHHPHTKRVNLKETHHSQPTDSQTKQQQQHRVAIEKSAKQFVTVNESLVECKLWNITVMKSENVC